MGCELGKLAASERRGAGGGAAGLADPPPPAVDPRLPLTAKQKYSMLASWKGISRAMEKTGICMFIKLFEENEDLLQMFEKFRQCKTKEEQANSMELAEHANNVMNTLDEGIKGLDDLDTFFAYIHQVGASHRRIPGFHVEYFWKIEAPFLAAVEQTLGDRYTPNVQNIYQITIKFILTTLVEGYEKAPAAAAGAGAAGTCPSLARAATLFEENEELLHLFDIFKGLPLEAHATSEELADHATKVMHTLDQGIKTLGDVDSFFEYIRHVGATHRRIKGFTSDNFWKIEKPFLQAAKATLGDRYTENIQNIYTITIRFILENLVQGYEDAGLTDKDG